MGDLGLERADDPVVWRHALEHGFTLVSKDADFAERSLSEGPPPKVIWIRRGNCSMAGDRGRLAITFAAMSTQGGEAARRASYTAIVERDGDGYVSLCPELDVASQGDTVEQAVANLREAVELFLECAGGEATS